LETTFTTETGKVTLTDAMAFADGERGHDVGLDAPHELLRSVKGLSGRVKLRMELAPRPEYGLVKPLMRLDDAGRARTLGGSGRVALRSGVALTMADSTIRATFTVAACEVTGFALRWAPPELRDPLPPTRPNAVAERIEETAEAWRSWEAEHDIYGGRIGSSCGKLTRAEGPDIPTDRRDRRGTHHLPAGDGGRRAQLGLPLRLDPRLQHDDRGPIHRRVPRGVEKFVSFMTSSAGGRAGEAHYRSCTASAANITSRSLSSAICVVGATRGRYAWATAPGSRCSSTSTASS